MSARNPVHPKVKAETTTSAATGLVTWLLVTGFWKHGLPPALAAALPGIVGVALGFIAGWLKRVAPVDVPKQATPPPLPPVDVL